MLLVVDIGNTNTALGLFLGKDLVEHWNIKSDAEKTCDEYSITLRSLFLLSGYDAGKIKGVIISSVVPPLTPVFHKLSITYLHIKPIIVGPGLKTGMAILYDNPLDVGADRIVLAVAAYEKYGGPVIVVDFGTATTFDVISSKGEYLGGAISPGVQIAAEALYLKTAKLPRVDVKKPDKAIGKTTETSMQSGLYFGYIGLVSYVIKMLNAELEETAKVVATGGFGSQIFHQVKSIDYNDPHLVLDGLHILFERNKKT